MDYDDPFQNLHIHLQKGQQHLNGAQAEQFMRFRQPNNYSNIIMEFYNGSDIDRIEAQQRFISEVIRQKANIKYATKANDILSAVFSKLNTNISMPDALKFVPIAAKLNATNVKMLTVPGDAVSEGYSYFLYNKAETTNIINKYFR
jgi:anionic cell wall polymer biosynthesis LytR-Cps2A-Psr (LCP) family protein